MVWSVRWWNSISSATNNTATTDPIMKGHGKLLLMYLVVLQEGLIYN